MTSLSPDGVLALVDMGSALPANERTLRLCVAARPDLDLDAIRAMPVGRRDAVLADLRSALFGATAACYVDCPACGDGLEFTLDVGDLASPPPDDGSPMWLDDGTWRALYRLPSSADLEAVAATRDARAAHALLLGRCLLEITAGGATPAPAGAMAIETLPPSFVQRVEDEMSRRDPHAAVTLSLTCAVCDHAWTALFDIADYLWQELQHEARRLLREVDTLARAYGWSEADIMRLGRQRRLAYLELLGTG